MSDFERARCSILLIPVVLLVLSVLFSSVGLESLGRFAFLVLFIVSIPVLILIIPLYFGGIWAGCQFESLIPAAFFCVAMAAVVFGYAHILAKLICRKYDQPELTDEKP